MKTSALRLAVIILSPLLLGACGASGSSDATVEKGMTDAVQAYTEAVYSADSSRIPSVVCSQDVSNLQAEMAKVGATNSGSTYDLSGVTFKVDKRNGDVVRLAITSGSVTIKTKSGNTLPNMPIPGSANGVVLKNENGWKVCYSASGSL